MYLLDDCQSTAAQPTSRLYGGLRETIVAANGGEVSAALQTIEARSADGHPVVVVFSYELGEWLQGLSIRPNQRIPLLTALIFQRVDVLSKTDVDELLEAADPTTETQAAGLLNVSPSLSEAAFEKDIAAIHEEIRKGTFYQLNHTFQWSGGWYGSPLNLYRRLRARQPTRFAAHLPMADETLLSFSPEWFLACHNGELVAKPMKGTLPKGQDPHTALRDDPKNQAENIMIVDLIRNDLGMISEVGSVTVPSLFEVEEVGDLYQMTSSIHAHLRPETSLEEVLRATFPCGSVTGAPKRKAMEWIQRLEPQRRGAYCGSVGWIDPPAPAADGRNRRRLGNFAWSVAIRSVSLRADRFQMGVGAGITIDSSASAEWEECRIKAGFLTGLPAAHGLFETIRLHGQEPQQLDAHLSRMAQSAASLHLPFDAARAHAALQAALSQHKHDGLGRLRLSLSPTGGWSASVHTVAPLDTPVRIFWTQTLLPDLDCPPSTDPLLRHKTTRRGFYDAAWRAAEAAGGFDALFINEHGHVTEGGRSTVWIVRNGHWITPPLQDGLLPGIERARMLADPSLATLEQSITPEDLLTADEVWVVSALRGRLPAVLAQD
jgi:para-aminobenzoate synthetase / 4-amino-4-deoxychorismate lyase